MMTMSAQPNRRFYRDRDNAWLGGVCAGLAEYLGFNLKVTRFLAFVAFLTAMPVAVIAYFAAVFLIPSASGLGRSQADIKESGFSRRHERRARRKEARARRHDRQWQGDPVAERNAEVVRTIDERCQTLDQRLATLEKHVTSRRFQLDQEFSRL